MKNKLLICLVGASLLSACAHDPLPPTKIEYKVVKPESSYFKCDEIPLPDPETLTDNEIAQLINDLVKENRTCANNIRAIDQYLDAAKKILEERKADS